MLLRRHKQKLHEPKEVAEVKKATKKVTKKQSVEKKSGEE